MTFVLRLVKAFVVLLLTVMVLISIVTGWLRWEYSLLEPDPDAMDTWNSVQVAAFDSDLPNPPPCRDQYPQKKAWFGGLHIHTSASYDATSFGSLMTADDAYQFGRGEPLALSLRGDPPDYQPPVVRIGAPLDFMAVTDHAESLGEARLCWNPDSDAWGTLPCRLYRGEIPLPVEERLEPIMRLVSFAIFGKDRSLRVCGPDGTRCIEQDIASWRENQRSTEAWQDRSADCSFTTFHAYEYSLAEASSNLHRNVIFSSATVPQRAMGSKDAQQPEALWSWLDRVCLSGDPACDAIAIPHNSNWSSGRMWHPLSNGDLTLEEQRSLAELRARVEPLAEISQVKGDSECRNGIASVFGAPDEFCDFEKLRPASEVIPDCGEEMGSGGMLLKGCVSRYSFVRYALSAGLAEQQALGINPFRLGIVAATDTHNAAPTSGAERNNLGSHGMDRNILHRLAGEVNVPGDIAKGSPIRYSPGGIAGVYAEENSREALFGAMRTRETFGTSGPRIEPRFFAGWELPADLCGRDDYLQTAYDGGVPMGGTLPAPGSSAARGPVFVASATRDASDSGSPLQRIQVVKGWIDDEGRTHQAVFDIAGDPDNGASVDPDTCAVSGTGFNQLCSTWRDPEFDPDTSAVYYARVLENPSCRWSRHDCLSLPEAERPATCSDPDLPWQIQERAWTSPIWYEASR